MRRRIGFLIVLLLIVTDGVYPQDAITISRENAIVRAVQKVSPAVLNISTTRIEQRATPFDDFWDLWSPFRIPRRREYHGLGSGVVIDPAGYVLTNQHVIAGAQKTKVILNDGREMDARIVGEDMLADLALLKVDTRDLPSIEMGDSDEVLIGEWAIAIGNPFASYVRDPHPTVTVGVISAKNRALRHDNRFYYSLLQTDASINPGNSGGALVNAQGKVIGINTAIFSTSGGSQGIGFAIPINIARKVVGKLKRDGLVIEPNIGLEYQDLTTDIAQYLNLTTTQGVLVSQVHEDGFGAKAGIRRLDVLQTIDGRSVDTIEETKAILRLLDVGESAKLGIIRNGKRRTVQMSIERLPEVYEYWGLKFVDLNASSYVGEYRHTGALVIKREAESPLKDIQPGDLIYAFSVDRRRPEYTRTLKEFISKARSVDSGDVITIHLERNGRDYYIPDWRVP